MTDVDCQHLSPASTRSSLAPGSEDTRPYTSSLGASLDIPVTPSNGISREPSVISDGGAQQQIRQLQGAGPKQVIFGAISDNEDSEEIDPVYELQERILDAFEETKNYQGHVQQFLPANELSRLVNPESVARELKNLSGNKRLEKDTRKLADEICRERVIEHDGRTKMTSFRKVFALLVISDAVSSIELFMNEYVSDIDLPLVTPTARKIKGLCRKTVVGESCDKVLKCFKGWQPVKVCNFREYQWKLLAPFFAQGRDGDVKHYRLQGQHILPFLKIRRLKGTSQEDDEKSGGFGRVFMVRIHENHHGFKDTRLNARGFAIKQQLHDSDAKVFRTEIEVLKNFSGDRGHRHIVSLLATFEQFNKLHLIFYRAEGDMFAYWNDRQTQPPPTGTNVKWLAAQCAGLSHGLLQLHKHLTFTRSRSGLHRVEQRHIGKSALHSQVKTKCEGAYATLVACLYVSANTGRHFR
jgi:hypothetical protein